MKKTILLTILLSLVCHTNVDAKTTMNTYIVQQNDGSYKKQRIQNIGGNMAENDATVPIKDDLKTFDEDYSIGLVGHKGLSKHDGLTIMNIDRHQYKIKARTVKNINAIQLNKSHGNRKIKVNAHVYPDGTIFANEIKDTDVSNVVVHNLFTPKYCNWNTINIKKYAKATNNSLFKNTKNDPMGIYISDKDLNTIYKKAGFKYINSKLIKTWKDRNKLEKNRYENYKKKTKFLEKCNNILDTDNFERYGYTNKLTKEQQKELEYNYNQYIKYYNKELKEFYTDDILEVYNPKYILPYIENLRYCFRNDDFYLSFKTTPEEVLTATTYLTNYDVFKGYTKSYLTKKKQEKEMRSHNDNFISELWGNILTEDVDTSYQKDFIYKRITDDKGYTETFITVDFKKKTDKICANGEFHKNLLKQSVEFMNKEQDEIIKSVPFYENLKEDEKIKIVFRTRKRGGDTYIFGGKSSLQEVRRDKGTHKSFCKDYEINPKIYYTLCDQLFYIIMDENTLLSKYNIDENKVDIHRSKL